MREELYTATIIKEYFAWWIDLLESKSYSDIELDFNHMLPVCTPMKTTGDKIYVNLKLCNELSFDEIEQCVVDELCAILVRKIQDNSMKHRVATNYISNNLIKLKNL